MLGATPFETIALWAVLGIALLGLAYALFLRRQIMAEDKGNPKMIEVWEAIRQGADAYLGRQLKTILPLIVVLTSAALLILENGGQAYVDLLLSQPMAPALPEITPGTM